MNRGNSIGNELVITCSKKGTWNLSVSFIVMELLFRRIRVPLRDKAASRFCEPELWQRRRKRCGDSKVCNGTLELTLNYVVRITTQGSFTGVWGFYIFQSKFWLFTWLHLTDYFKMVGWILIAFFINGRKFCQQNRIPPPHTHTCLF